MFYSNKVCIFVETFKQIEIMKNYYIGGNIGRIIKFWKSKSTPETKGGSFNLDLYLQYLNAIK